MCAAAGAVFLLMAVLYRIWRRVLPAMTDRRVGLALAILLGVAVDITAFMPPEGRPLAAGFGLDVARQTVALVRGWHPAAGGGGAFCPGPPPPPPPRPHVAGRPRAGG